MYWPGSTLVWLPTCRPRTFDESCLIRERAFLTLLFAGMIDRDVEREGGEYVQVRGSERVKT